MNEKKKEDKVIKIRDTGDNNSEEVLVTRSPPLDDKKREEHKTDTREEKE